MHSAYEDTMLRRHSVELLSLLTAKLKNIGSVKAPSTGKEAAVRTVELMRSTFATIKPIDIVNAYADGKDLWPLFKDDTVKVIAAGVATMRAIWKGAWNQGSGNTIAAANLGAAPTKDLIKLYMTSTWMPSKSLKTIGTVLGIAPAGAAGGAVIPPVKKKVAKKKAVVRMRKPPRVRAQKKAA